MVTLGEIKQALSGIDHDGTGGVKQIEEAVQSLKAAQKAMDTIPVCGRHDVDALLGCMIGIDLLIGEEKNGR